MTGFQNSVFISNYNTVRWFYAGALAWRPPSTKRISPVMEDDWSEARNRITLATSTGSMAPVSGCSSVCLARYYQNTTTWISNKESTSVTPVFLVCKIQHDLSLTVPLVHGLTCLYASSFIPARVWNSVIITPGLKGQYTKQAS